jgi:hypothetical protein
LVGWIVGWLEGELVNGTALATTGVETPPRDLHAGS